MTARKRQVRKELTCRICGACDEHNIYKCEEKMFGSAETFEYFQCRSCECLQIKEIPTDMCRYYPPDYYSYNPKSNAGSIRKKLIGLRDLGISGENQLARSLTWAFPDPQLQALVRAGASKSARILDIGCGRGKFLLRLHALGFRHLTGLDPFIDEDIEYPGGIRIHKTTLDRLQPDHVFDLIMLHHSLEHMADNIEVLRQVHRLLTIDGTCIVRIPLVDSHAWKKYSADWVQLDAPRHFYLHSQKSMAILCERSGFEISGVHFDSTAFQFLGSETYRRGKPLADMNDLNNILLLARKPYYGLLAAFLNKTQKGDQAVFYLHKR